MELEIKITGGDAWDASQIINGVLEIINTIEARDSDITLKPTFSFEEKTPVMRHEESTPFTRYINSATYSTNNIEGFDCKQGDKQ